MANTHVHPAVTITGSLVGGSVPGPSDIFGASLFAHWPIYDVGLDEDDPITAVTDASGNGRDLATTGTVPFKTSLVNGKGGAAFPGAALGYMKNTFGADLEQVYFIFFVGNIKSTASDLGILDGIDVARRILLARYGGATGNLYTYLGAGLVDTGATESFPTGYSVFELVQNGASSAIKEAGSSIATGDLGGNYATGITVGAKYTNIQGAVFDCSDLFIVKKASISAGERTQLQAYFTNQFNLAS